MEAIRSRDVGVITREGGIGSECDIRENFDTNECPNIFVSTKLHE